MSSKPTQKEVESLIESVEEQLDWVAEEREDLEHLQDQFAQQLAKLDVIEYEANGLLEKLEEMV